MHVRAWGDALERCDKPVARILGVVERDDPGVACSEFQPFQQTFGDFGGCGLAMQAGPALHRVPHQRCGHLQKRGGLPLPSAPVRSVASGRGAPRWR